VIGARDGGIWFSDPHYGILTDHENFCAEHQPCRKIGKAMHAALHRQSLKQARVGQGF